MHLTIKMKAFCHSRFQASWRSTILFTLHFQRTDFQRTFSILCSLFHEAFSRDHPFCGFSPQWIHLLHFQFIASTAHILINGMRRQITFNSKTYTTIDFQALTQTKLFIELELWFGPAPSLYKGFFRGSGVTWGHSCLHLILKVVGPFALSISIEFTHYALHHKCI